MNTVHNVAVIGFLAAMLLTADATGAELASTPVPGGCDTPASQQGEDIGCYLLATQSLKRLPADGKIFWHLYTYSNRASAEAAQKGSTGTVVESFGKIWLLAIADSKWRPPGGNRVAVVGPLPVAAAKAYTARYMQAVFPPQQNMRTSIHQHSGPEAWYVVSGAQCLLTPKETLVIRAGEGGFVRAGASMQLTSIGTETRRAMVLVLHDESQPWMTFTSDWSPTTQCPEA